MSDDESAMVELDGGLGGFVYVDTCQVVAVTPSHPHRTTARLGHGTADDQWVLLLRGGHKVTVKDTPKNHSELRRLARLDY